MNWLAWYIGVEFFPPVPTIALTNEEFRVFQEFWEPLLVGSDGTVHLGLVMHELYDYHQLLENTAKVYDHITGGRISKPNTVAEAVISEADARVMEQIQEALAAETEGNHARG